MITGICISFLGGLKFKQGVKGDVYLYTFGLSSSYASQYSYVSSFGALDTNLVLRSPLPSFCRSLLLQALRYNIEFSACSG
jgi:hypothetical protein